MARSAGRTQITKALLHVRQAILDGEFAPGERMSELPLVQRIGVSRTPLRLALAELETEGLLHRLPAGGYVVRQFTQGDVRDAIELRGVLEGTAARFAAERGVPARAVNALRAANAAIHELVHLSDSASLEQYLRLNETFHARLLSMVRSPLLERSMATVVSLPFAGPSAFVLAEAELIASQEIIFIGYRQHAALIEAIERRQGARAEALAREHALLALANLEFVIERREVLEKMPGAGLLALTRTADRALG
ncbi:MAG TPA: GntR family transcriptional regulator [Solirubrobacteraceae bacterium]|nr:GntR family transcriptional regulator [Solirubrobacteraceae bacterium]